MLIKGTLVIAVHDGRSLDDRTRELISAAQMVTGTTTLGIVAAAPHDIADQASIAGVDEVVTVQVPASQYEPESHRRAVQALIEDCEPRVVLMGFGVGAASYGAALANSLDLGFAADVIGIAEHGDQLVATRPLHGSKVYAEMEFDHSAVLMLLRPAVWEPASDTDKAPVARELTVESVGPIVEHLESFPRATGEVDLSAADVIFAVGRGVREPGRIAIFQDIARRIGAAFGATRPLVDAGWLPADRQIGQSGQAVKPRVYVAFGISGALQHLAGVWDSQEIFAVNTDESAPIFDVATFGSTADMFEVADELNKLV